MKKIFFQRKYLVAFLHSCWAFFFMACCSGLCCFVMGIDMLDKELWVPSMKIFHWWSLEIGTEYYFWVESGHWTQQRNSFLKNISVLWCFVGHRPRRSSLSVAKPGRDCQSWLVGFRRIGRDSLAVPGNDAGGGLNDLTAVSWAELVKPS